MLGLTWGFEQANAPRKIVLSTTTLRTGSTCARSLFLSTTLPNLLEEELVDALSEEEPANASLEDELVDTPSLEELVLVDKGTSGQDLGTRPLRNQSRAKITFSNPFGQQLI